jgi:hypothetical protein
MAADPNAIKVQGPDMAAGSANPFCVVTNSTPGDAAPDPGDFAISAGGQGSHRLGGVGLWIFNGSSWDRERGNLSSTPLATQAGSNATRNSADLTNYNGRGIALHVKVANLAGAPTFTPRIQWKDNSGNYNTIWTASAALSANGDKMYLLYPGAADAAAWTEQKQTVLPRTFRVVLVYTGNGTTDTADTTVDLEILL